jgi:predicted metalloprotease with PDZ domain
MERKLMRSISLAALSLRFLIALFIALSFVPEAPAQRRKEKPSPAPAARPLSLSYELAFPRPYTHLYEVTLTIANVSTAQLDLQLPTWTPGSYLQREYARNVQDFSATVNANQTLTWRKIDKATWQIDAGAGPDRPKTIEARYRVYANELFTQTSHLDATHAYFNGASLLMYAPTAKDQPHRIKFLTTVETAPGKTQSWKVTTPLGLEPDAQGYYTAADYDRLIDSPTEIGTHKLLEFTVQNKLHRAAIWGEYQFDDNRLKADLTRIVETGARMFGGLPYEHYLFIIHVQPGIRGGTEHLNSNVSMTTPEAFQTVRGYKRFLSLESHEYFHHWNVKRIRPMALGPFDYQHENYTKYLWFCEGVTSYYGDLILRRAGLLSAGEYFEGLASMLAGYEQTPGRFQQSPEQASFDTWIKLYRQDENSINTAMSYYTTGEILGLLLDLEIRSRTAGAKSLDDVMRLLLENHGLPKPGFTDAELKATFEKVAGGDLSDFWRRYISGREVIDFQAWLGKAGLQLIKGYSTPSLAGAEKPGTLGMRTKAEGDRVIVSATLTGLPAYDGGVNTGDEIAAIDGMKVDAGNIEQKLNRVSAGQRIALTLFRRDRLLNIELTAAIRPFDRYQITELREAGQAEQALRQAWIAGANDPMR